MRRPHTFSREIVLALWVVSIGSIVGCQGDTSASAAPEVPFDSLLGSAQSFPLVGESPVEDWVAGLVTKSRVVVLDAKGARGKIFSRTGQRLGEFGGPGDAAGNFRRPQAIAALADDTWIVLDAGRRVLVHTDSFGHFLRETVLPPGAYTALVPLRSADHVLLAGDIFPSRGTPKRLGKLHELRLDGVVDRSFEPSEIDGSFRAKFGAVFGARIDHRIITGAMNSTELSLQDLESDRKRHISIAPGWYRTPQWPSNAFTGGSSSGQNAADRVRQFLRANLLPNGVFTLSGGRFLVRLQTYDANDRRSNAYVVADTTGKTFAVTRPTRAFVFTAVGDTVFWIAPGEHGEPRVSAAVVRPVSLQTASARQ